MHRGRPIIRFGLANPGDPLAPYYLGNLFYEHQPGQAIAYWEKSRQLDDSFYIIHRNLGLAYEEVQHDPAKALASMTRAVACNGDNPRLLFEVDELNELNRVSPEKKYEFLKENLSTVRKRSETILRLATRSVEYGKYDEALEILRTNFINESEGAVEMQNAYLNIYALKSLEYIKSAQFEKALGEVEAAQAYPVGLNLRPRYAQFDYLAGVIYRGMGEKAKADDLFRKAIAVKIEGRSANREDLYYQGLAMQELGNPAEAKGLFLKMLDEASKGVEGGLSGGQTSDPRSARDHYLAGLAYKGLGEREKARAEFGEALKANPSDIWSEVHLRSL